MKARWFFKGSTIVMMVWLILLVSACAAATPAPTPTFTQPATPVSGGTAESSPPTEESGDAAAGISTAAAARTPIPTPTPTGFEETAESFAERTGLSGRTFLGIPVPHWFDLAGAALLIVAGYFIARLLINQILGWIVQRTKTKLDDEIFATAANELRWLVVIYIADFAVSGLAFLSDNLRTLLDDLFFLAVLVILTALALEMVRGAANHFKANLSTDEDRKRLSPVIVAVRRFTGFLVLILALSIGLAHFNLDTNAFYITLLIAGLIFSLAARDVVTDALSGFIILADQPFREGDSLYIEKMDTWGDVLEIGTRTTRILTIDNRELILPNSQVVKGQIVNYNYPDSRHMLQTDIAIAYGIDIDQMRKTAKEAVRSVEGILDDKPVDVLFIEFDNLARQVRVRWWIADFHTIWTSLDAVNTALEVAFERDKIDLLHDAHIMRVQIENDKET
jgi:small-conductance mechanosensitive channel